MHEGGGGRGQSPRSPTPLPRRFAMLSTPGGAPQPQRAPLDWSGGAWGVARRAVEACHGKQRQAMACPRNGSRIGQCAEPTGTGSGAAS